MGTVCHVCSIHFNQKQMTFSPRPIFHFRTYDPSECTSTGYDIEFFDNETLSEPLYYAVLTYESKWQGSESGQKYKVNPIPKDVADAFYRELNNKDHGHEPDLAAAIDTWLELEDPSCENWKKIRSGSKIR
jgi:hypothetical protein